MIPWHLDHIATTDAALMYTKKLITNLLLTKQKRNSLRHPTVPLSNQINSSMTVNTSLHWLIITPLLRTPKWQTKVVLQPPRCPQPHLTRSLWLPLPTRWQCKTLQTWNIVCRKSCSPSSRISINPWPSLTPTMTSSPTLSPSSNNRSTKIPALRQNYAIPCTVRAWC